MVLNGSIDGVRGTDPLCVRYFHVIQDAYRIMHCGLSGYFVAVVDVGIDKRLYKTLQKDLQERPNNERNQQNAIGYFFLKYNLYVTYICL